MPVRWIDFLSREYHHIKIHGEEGDRYEPTMVIMDHNHPGKSFQIPLPALWKYIEPHDNKDAAPDDREEYQQLKDRVVFKKRTAAYDYQHAEANADLACCFVAEMLAKGMGFLLCTAYNLSKCMQMFDISPSPQNAAQLLMWIQDGLDDLKNMSPAPYAEDEYACGEIKIFDGSNKIADKTLTVPESELLQ